MRSITVSMDASRELFFLTGGYRIRQYIRIVGPDLTLGEEFVSAAKVWVQIVAKPEGNDPLVGLGAAVFFMSKPCVFSSTFKVRSDAPGIGVRLIGPCFRPQFVKKHWSPTNLPFAD